LTLANPKVVVLGSLHYDIIVDAPGRPRKGETVTGRSWAPKCGGKGGNQAVAAAKAGVVTSMIGAVGSDEFGDALLANLDRSGVERSGVTVLEGAASGMSVAIFDDEGDYGAVIVSGSNLSIAAEQCDDARLRNADVLVLQNEVLEAINLRAAANAKRLGVRTILNAAPARPFTTDLLAYVDVLIVNAIEAEMIGGGIVNSLNSASIAAQALTSQCAEVVVTAGGDGVAYADRSGSEHAFPAIPVVVASTHGAGDMFVGTLAAELAKGSSAAVGIAAANQSAARLVSTPEAGR
jgi:ribokinase